MDIDIILPVYNERDSIVPVLDEWKNELSRLHVSYRFILCEDGSTDGTGELLKTISSKYPMLLDQSGTRRGYAGAVVAGINDSTAKYILCIDSDGQCDPADLAKFWKERDTADVVIGWRTAR